MKYMKAAAIFPEELLKEIQKYVQGEMIYIPNPAGLRRKWGEHSGSRQSIRERNESIRRQHQLGMSIEELAIEHFLSRDSIKKIVYFKNKG